MNGLKARLHGAETRGASIGTLGEFVGRSMEESGSGILYRFGVFEVDGSSGELRRQGMRIRVHAQPMQVLFLLLARPGEVLTREEIARELWPEGTFVDFEHGVNSAVNRIREALGDRAKSPRYIETLARRGYRFVAPVERLGETKPKPGEPLRSEVAEGESPELLTSVEMLSGSQPDLGELTAPEAWGYERLLASAEDLPAIPAARVRALFVLLQAMYLGFYVGALANLGEIEQLASALSSPGAAMAVLLLSAVLLILVRVFLLTAVLLRAPGFRERYLRLWPYLVPADLLWAMAPFLLLHHMGVGVALACMAPLVYAPFAQRSLILMGAAAE